MRINPVVRVLVVGASALVCSGAARAQSDLYPDIIVDPNWLYDNAIENSGSQRLLRLSNGTANAGEGPLHLYGVFPPNDDGTQTVRQRIFRTNGTFWDRDAGYFVYHSGHNHIHFDNWAIYRLREVLANDGVGATVAEGDKTSFCILDLGVYDNSLPNFDPDGFFHSCSSTTQGLSVGWIDIYSKNLSGQFIDITGVPDGVYWLESEVDPFNNCIETDESNNIARIKVSIGSGGTIDPDRMEPNNSRSAVDGRPEGGSNSPNLGPCDPVRTESALTVHNSTDQDYFKFYMNSTGTPSDYVRLDFIHAQGDLDMELLNSSGSVLARSDSSGNFEQISLNGRTKGRYYVRVYGWQGATSPAYSLTIDPPANTPPSIDILTPPPGDTQLIHGEQTYQVDWIASDPTNDAMWVTVYLNHHPELDEHAIRLESSIHTPASQGFYVVNTAEAPPDTYYVLCAITDGGTTVVQASDGTLSFVEFCPGDFNSDDLVDTRDVLEFLAAWIAQDPETDVNADGVIDSRDVLRFLSIWTAPCG